MGIAVSGWRLASAVATCGQVGIVSGVGLGVLLTRRLQNGDVGGHYRRALAHFPVPEIAHRILSRYFIEGGKAPAAPFASTPMPSVQAHTHLDELTTVACFAEVWLAKQGHTGLIGMNLLTKIQVQTLASLYGAMLAGVDIISMGAGIPLQIPGALDRFAIGQDAELTLDVIDGRQMSVRPLRFSPARLMGDVPAPLKRPAFFPIISSVTLATVMQRRATGKIDGFVVESPTAGGHNAPPRGHGQDQRDREIVWGERDKVDLSAIAKAGLPFYVAGGQASPEALKQARAAGATGVQVGSVFAFCNESGLAPQAKLGVLNLVRTGQCNVRTDGMASPTGFPFKVAQLDGTLSQQQVYLARQRTCEFGFMREAYALSDGGLGWRCAAEPVDDYVAKGGLVGDTVGRRCLCAGLAAAVSLASTDASGQDEPMIITSGQELHCVAELLKGRTSYSAAQAIAAILA